jgi:YidC/Oxa1 family membrane protein insertase
MEKRLLIAFVASFLFLSIWGQLFPPAKPVPGKPVASQPIVKTEAVPPKDPLPSSVDEIPLEKKVKQISSFLENEKIKVEFSNIGGTIEKIVIKEHQATLPVTGIQGVYDYETAEFVLSQSSSDTVQYVYEDEEIRIIKEYLLPAQEYIIKSKISLADKKGKSRQKRASINGFSLDISRLDKKLVNERDISLDEYSVGSLSGAAYRKAGFFQYSKEKNGYVLSRKEQKADFSEIRWMGFRDRYYCLVIKPNFKTAGYKILPRDDQRVSFEVLVNDEALPSSYESDIYFGPQKLELLKKYGMDEIMKFSNFGLVDIIAKWVYYLISFIHKTIPSLGLCIILTGIFVYFLTYPLTMMSLTSMKRMQSLQPAMTKLREQHKNNPQKLNKEMLELYKEHKVNPMGGCLPVLLQMPIFIGLYQVLWRSILFKGSSFLWIKDLAEPDRLFLLPTTFPVIGNEFNLLPILMVFVMMIQQKLTSKNMVMTDPSQAMQQKMMLIVFPAMIGLVFYKTSSGLTLYFTIFYMLSSFTQWKISKATKVP